MERISFKVAPYALQDTIRVLNQNGKDFYNEVFVTKEDNELVIICNKKFIRSLEQTSNTPTQRGE